jgi:quercetin dioxygenase-like cupin family protein
MSAPDVSTDDRQDDTIHDDDCATIAEHAARMTSLAASFPTLVPELAAIILPGCAVLHDKEFKYLVLETNPGGSFHAVLLKVPRRFRNDTAVAIAWGEAGTTLKEHVHTNEVETFFIIRGHLHVTLLHGADVATEHELGPRDHLIIPVNVPHRCTMNEHVEFLVTTVPAVAEMTVPGEDAND